LSRCQNGEEIARVLARAGTDNPRVLLSLLFHYGDPAEKERFFVFTRLGTLRVHTETARENARRRSRLSPETRAAVSAFIRSELERTLRGRLGKVWVDPAMKKIALPSFQGAVSPGFGTLTPGSRITLPPGKKLRAFLYWEKVDDIDLSVIGLNGNWKEREFSWRTMAGNQSEAILYSGDQTAGFHGGSEFFDVSLDLFRARYPGIRYLVFCANVFSDAAFSSCVARAGYMMRDEEDSGGIFEAKTVSSAFKIDAPSTFAYLYALDLSAREIVWLNLSRSGSTHVAGETGFAFLDRAFRSTGVMNVYDLVTLMASEAADSPEKADLIVGDGDYSALGKEQIRSVDAEKIAALPDRR
ncbi:MAG: TerD family protein, partial [Clostridia bacterium]|nr:TerD family protein [Clostridia bacterium]